MSGDFKERFSRDLPQDLAAKVNVGNLDCFRDGCVMALDYREDATAATNFSEFLERSEAFNRWPGPKMRIENKPGLRSAGEKWCFFRSAETAKMLLAQE